VLAEFRSYRHFVPKDSYVVIEDTVVNGHPVWPTHGPGPFEAVWEILHTDRDFAPDSTWERYGLTFNASGYLKRIR